MKILIAEDDENSRELLETLLTAEGYQVVSFENGLKALAHLQSEAVDLIISDILMPEMDGYGFCRAVKQNYLLKNIPFIFYTATYTSAQDEQFGLSLGAIRFLEKPMLIPELTAVIKAVIGPKYIIEQPPKVLPNYLGTLEEQHVDRVRSKLDKKIVELQIEKEKLQESETRFKDFTEASADWFWETDEYLHINRSKSHSHGLHLVSLTELAEHCQNHTPNEFKKLLAARLGFKDYVSKAKNDQEEPFDLRISGKPFFDENKRFLGYRCVGRDVTEMVALSERVEFLASYDELTSLPNRRLLKQHLQHAIAKCKRSGQKALVLYFDLDNFKLVNDTLGHDKGDQLLLLASKRISCCVRPTDLLYRIGGDEFVMLMEYASPQDGNRLVRDILDAFAQPFDLQGKQVYCTTSIGVSVYPDDSFDPQTLLINADMAMYRAKQNGRHNFEFYTPNLNFIAHQWFELEHGIRQALEHQQFYLMYQPQFENEFHQLVGLEALLRWQHPERGLIPCDEFIDIAEQSSLINLIGEWVLESVCRQIRAWLDAGINVPMVSINISPRHLRSESLRHTFVSIPEKYHIDPTCLGIEITERALLEDSFVVKQNMQFLKQAGFYIALDDFSMGYSSLLYLKRAHVDEVKIDRAFIQNLASSEQDRIIVKALVMLSSALGLNLIAEGVENQQQADIVMACGCKQVQGYFYARPLTVESTQDWLNQNHSLPKAAFLPSLATSSLSR